MLNKLRARHYSILVLLAIVTLESSAIAIDRYLSKGDDMAFEVEGRFRNNAFVSSFQQADAKQITPPDILFAKNDGALKSNVKANSVGNTSLQVTNSVAPADKSVPEISQWCEYTVAKGDSLKGIAETFNVNANLLAQFNSISNSNIKVGQQLRIPVNGNRFTYKIRAGDSLSKIASRFNVSISEIMVTNNLKNHVLVEDEKIYIPLKCRVQQKPQIVRNNAVQVIAPPLIKIEGSNERLSMIRTPSLSMADTQENKNVSVKRTAQTQLASVDGNAQAKVKANAVVKNVIAQVQNSNSTQNADSETKIVKHTVKSGECLANIAGRYKVSIDDIKSGNNLTSSTLKPGQELNIPVSKKYYRVMQVTSRRADVSTKLHVPVRGRISDQYGWRKHPVYRKRLFHAGIDIAAPRGTPIAAAMGGTVVYAGWLSGYGKLVVIRHANGLSTRYGHCSSLRVKQGQTVKAGQTIAAVGATGVATGNHLHFEVRRNGRTLNPMSMLYGL